MTSTELARPTTQRARDQAAERQRRYREAHRKPDRSRRAVDDIGPAIAEGEPISDNLERCDERWARLLAGRRFHDAAIRIIVAGFYEPTAIV